MTRSRALNRSNRITAKRRRRALKTALPGMQDDFCKTDQAFDHAKHLLEKASQKDVFLELIETS